MKTPVTPHQSALQVFRAMPQKSTVNRITVSNGHVFAITSRAESSARCRHHHHRALRVSAATSVTPVVAARVPTAVPSKTRASVHGVCVAALIPRRPRCCFSLASIALRPQMLFPRWSAHPAEIVAAPVAWFSALVVLAACPYHPDTQPPASTGTAPATPTELPFRPTAAQSRLAHPPSDTNGAAFSANCCAKSLGAPSITSPIPATTPSARALSTNACRDAWIPPGTRCRAIGVRLPSVSSNRRSSVLPWLVSYSR